jgi:cyclophilin family peptidyl-prolyl cis-trans isomerase
MGSMSAEMRRTTITLSTTLVCAMLLAAACGDSADTTTTESTAAPGAEAAAAVPDGCPNSDGTSPQTKQFSAPPPMCLVAGETYRAEILTTLGPLRVDLRSDIAPNTVNSFVFLSRFGYFNGTTCHRAIQGFVVQCGDPTATGSGGPGYAISDELTQIEPYQIGSLAMAKTPGATEHGSQFFVISGPNGTALPPDYTLFGQVIAEDVALLAQYDAVANPNDGPPLTPIDIVSVTITTT